MTSKFGLFIGHIEVLEIVMVCKLSNYKQLFTSNPADQIVHFIGSALHSPAIIIILFINTVV